MKFIIVKFVLQKGVIFLWPNPFILLDLLSKTTEVWHFLGYRRIIILK